MAKAETPGNSTDHHPSHPNHRGSNSNLKTDFNDRATNHSHNPDADNDPGNYLQADHNPGSHNPTEHSATDHH